MKSVSRRSAVLAAAAAVFALTACQIQSDNPSKSRTDGSNEPIQERPTGGADTPIQERPTGGADNPPQELPTDGADSKTPVDLSDFVTLKNKDLNTDFTESECSVITLNHTTAECSGSGVTTDGSRITVTAPGDYLVRGTLDDGQIIVNAQNTDDVRLIFDDVSITCSDNAPLYIVNADKVVLTLAAGSDNYVCDGSSYNNADGTEEANAAIFSKDDLTINGSGSLTVDATFNNGIGCKDDLKLVGAAIHVNAVNDGIKGKDSVTVAGGSISVVCGGDGIQASNDTDEGKGYLHIIDGDFDIASQGDGLQAARNIYIENGTFSLLSGGGSANGSVRPNGMGRWDFSFNEDGSANDASIKGIKSDSEIRIDSGTFSLNCADDALHSNGGISLNGGSFALASGDDAIHADGSLTIADGEIKISASYEGIEAAQITVNGGEIELAASDDGLNASDGASLSMDGMHGGIGGFGGRGGFGGSSACSITINGGTIYINASGDGIDSNGSVTMNGGTVVVDGPTDNGNAALDCDAFYMNGGYLAAAGSSGMACNIASDSSQCGALIAVNGQTAQETVTVADSDGRIILSFTPAKSWNALNISTPDMKLDETYRIYSGGTVSGSSAVGSGCFIGGVILGGAELANFTQSATAYSSGNMGGIHGGFGGGNGGFGGHGGGFGDDPGGEKHGGNFGNGDGSGFGSM